MKNIPRRRSLLILSFSDIANDARVLKQVALFRDRYEVTTCGYGVRPEGVHGHMQIPDEEILGSPYGRLLRLRMFGLAYAGLRVVKWSRAHIPKGVWDAVLANDVDSVPIALELRAPHGVHADLHEYSPRMKEEIPAWRKLQRPYYEWVCRRYVTKAASWTTVSEGLANEYSAQFGISAVIVTNAAPFAELAPRSVADPIKLVHSGGCLRRRNLIALLDAVALTRSTMTLDLYLTPNDPAYLAELKSRAEEVPGVTIHPPVPYSELIELLNRFDVGVHLLPPVNFNSVAALPNKLFDYVQARLAVVVGPTREMASRVREYGLGVVTDDFTAEALADALNRLDADAVWTYKTASDRSAEVLSAEHQASGWVEAIDRLLPSGRAPL